jgi:hypothetical protein
MKTATADFETIVRIPTAQEAAGATIAIGARGWIPSHRHLGSNRHDQETRLWKWCAHGTHRTIPTGAWKSRTEREIPTFPQAASFFMMY